MDEFPVGGVIGLQYTLLSAMQAQNAPLPIEVTLSPIVTLVRLLQKQNANSPIEVTLLPIVTLVSERQS